MRILIDFLFGSIMMIALASAPILVHSQETVVMEANSEERKLPPFHSIEVENGLLVYLAQGNSSAVAVSAEERKDLPMILTEVKNGVLKIKMAPSSRSSGKWNRKLKAFVTVETLRSLSFSGGSICKGVSSINAGSLQIKASGGSIITLSLSGAGISAEASGGSILTLKGNATGFRTDVSGGSIVKAGDLKATETEVDASGGSVVTVHALNQSRSNASGGSSITIYGNASISQEEKSGGSVVRRVRE